MSNRALSLRSWRPVRPMALLYLRNASEAYRGKRLSYRATATGQLLIEIVTHFCGFVNGVPRFAKKSLFASLPCLDRTEA